MGIFKNQLHHLTFKLFCESFGKKENDSPQSSLLILYKYNARQEFFFNDLFAVIPHIPTIKKTEKTEKTNVRR